jgi:putative ABC transport system substrate-binding protein
MNRKIIIGLLIIGALLSTVYFATAQQSKKVWRVGLFHVGLDHVPPSLPTLQQELKKLGYEEGKNIHLDWRNLPDEDAANATAKEFVRERYDLIVAFESQTVRAAEAATAEIPVVFLHVSDPVGEGFIKSIAHPGGNMTGFGGVGDIAAKRMELFKEVYPKLRRVLIFLDPDDKGTVRPLADIRAMAQSHKLMLVEYKVATQAEIEQVFAALRTGDADGAFVISSSLNTKFFSLFNRLASEKRLPMSGYRKEWISRGALYSYSHDLASFGPPAAGYIDKIFKGTKVGDLPFQDSARFEFMINLKAAKQLGITIPPNVLARADRVIK